MDSSDRRVGAGLVLSVAIVALIVVAGLAWYFTRPTKVYVRLDPSLMRAPESLKISVTHGASSQHILAARLSSLAQSEFGRQLGPTIVRGRGDAALHVGVATQDRRDQVLVLLPIGGSYEWFIEFNEGSRPETPPQPRRGRSGVTSLPLSSGRSGVVDTLWMTWDARPRALVLP